MASKRIYTALIIGGFVGAVLAGCGEQQSSGDPGVTDTEIKIGSTNPYSGPASAYGTIGRASSAYFKMINEQGGVNGRQINFISLDDGYSPPRTVEQIRKLVEGAGFEVSAALYHEAVGEFFHGCAELGQFFGHPHIDLIKRYPVYFVGSDLGLGSILVDVEMMGVLRDSVLEKDGHGPSSKK